ncbi:site-specific integrase [Brevibacillus brevis]|nr:site-specific integrase [Brevibacillus brevis]
MKMDCNLNAFHQKWAEDLFFSYVDFVRGSGVGSDTVKRYTSKARIVFQRVDNELGKPGELTEEWFARTLSELAHQRGIGKSLRIFLEQQNILSVVTQDAQLEKQISSALDRCPKGYRRLLEVYCNDRKKLRQRQISNNERKPLSLKTILSDLTIFNRFVYWVVEFYPEVSSWDLVQEHHVHTFLLTLTQRHREIVRKDLHMLFRFAKKKRLIVHVPIMDFPARELPANEAHFLTLEEQVHIAQTISSKAIEDPVGSILSSFCLFHGLSSEQIRMITIADVDLDCKKINILGRPALFLAAEDLGLLNEYAKYRAEIRNSSQKKYLFLSKDNSGLYEDKPVSKKFVLDKVRTLTGYTPKTLRITCFNAIAAEFGSQMLIDAFGLSMTQSARYGKFEEYLLEEEIGNQRK